MREVLRHDGIPWHNHLDPQPETIVGDLHWTDYTVTVDAQIPVDSYALLLGRISVVPQNDKLPNGYAFKIAGNGEWELRAIRTTVGPKPWDFKTTGDTGAPLIQGHADFAANSWHHLELGMKGDEISVRSDGKILAMVHDSTHSHGQVGLGSGWPGADITKFSVSPNSLSK